ncbi:MAG: NADP-dependent oxidoreductase [Minwuia sp.]|nr:NADP-dependent oxidoreductase [Minwuia sp.]
MTAMTRRIVLARFCDGPPVAEDFRIEEAPMPEPREGQFLVRNILISVDPGTRSRLSGKPSYIPPLKLGATVGAFSIGEIIESRHPDFAPGEIVSLADGWAEHVIGDPRGFVRRITDRRLPLAAWLGVLGVSGMTAWFGLHRVAGLKAGETVVVTSAAGAVGSAAGQLARLHGCTVIGVAGGQAKCDWMTDVALFDAAIDYKATGDLSAAIAAAAPKGVDVLFDNVGNAMIDQVIPLMRQNARIVVSGQVDAYNSDESAVAGIRHTRAFITHRLMMQGLVVFDDLPNWGAAETAMADHMVRGELAGRWEVLPGGLEATPDAFAGLFRGENTGRRLVRLAPDPDDFPKDTS